MRWIAPAALVVGCLAGCFESRLVYCENGAICPATLVCTERTPTVCGIEEIVAPCKTMPDRTACTYPGMMIGTCASGVCSDCAPELVECRYAGEWKVMRSPTAQQLTSLWVVADDSVYAGGAGRTVLHYDGTRWNQLPEPQTDYSIVGIYANSAADVVAIAGDGAAFRLAGDTWTTITPTTPMTMVRLNGMWGARIDSLFAVGSINPTTSQGVIQRYDGAAWSLMTSNLAAQLFGVSGSSDANVVAIGGGGAIQRYNGSAWSPVAGTPITNGANLRGVWTSETTIFTAGFVATPAPVMIEGTVWQQQGTTFVAQKLQAQPLTGVWGGADDDVYAVGEAGGIHHYDGASWSPMTSPLSSNLSAVHGTATSVFAVGDSGTILRYSVP
jgi:hypothetical protein